MTNICLAANGAVGSRTDVQSAPATPAVMKITRAGGFTMIELMVVIALAAIMLGLAVPNIYDAILNSRLSQATNEMTAAINVARSEAIKRGAETGLCGSPGITSYQGAQLPTEADCVAGGGNWESGWMVMVPDEATGGFVASRIFGGFDPAIQVENGSSGLYAISFDRRGNLLAGNPLQITICDDRGAEDGKTITIGTNGRIETRQMGGTGNC